MTNEKARGVAAPRATDSTDKNGPVSRVYHVHIMRSSLGQAERRTEMSAVKWRARAVIEVLHAVARDGVAMVGKLELATRASLSERQVDAVIRELVAGELLELVRLGGGRAGRSYVPNAYALSPRLDELANARAWRRRPAWAPHLDALIRARGASVSPCAVRTVYAALLDRRSRDGDAWPAVDTLVAACAGMARSTVLVAHRVLVELGLVAVRRTQPGEAFPNGVPARVGSLVRTVALPPPPPALIPAHGGPLIPAHGGPASPHTADRRGAHGGREVDLERVRERESAGAPTRTREGDQVLAAIDAAHWNGLRCGRFKPDEHELAALAAERYGLPAVLRAVVDGVAASRWFTDESYPGRRHPRILLDPERLAELVMRAGDGRTGVDVDMLASGSDIRTAPRVVPTAEQITKSRADAARLFQRRTA